MIPRLAILLLMLLGSTLRADFIINPYAYSAAPAADPILSFTPAVSAWLPMTNLAPVNTDVPYVQDRSGHFHSLIATNANQPAATNNGVHWNGTSDIASFGNWNSPTEGGTNATTGLCYDRRTGNAWGVDYNTSIFVNYRPDGHIVGKLTNSITPLFAQGLGLKAATGDFYVACTNGFLHRVNSNGITTWSTNLVATYTPNGVVYEDSTGQLLVMSDGGVVYTYWETNFSLIGSVSVATAEADGITIGTNGNGFIFQDGASFNASAILEFDRSTGSILNTYNFASVINPEHGFQFPDGRWLWGVDDRYHNGGIRTDHFIHLKSDFSYDDIGRATTGVTITALIKPVSLTGSRFIAFLSDGATENVGRQAMFLNAGKMTAFGRIVDGGSSASAASSGNISTSEYTLLTCVFDYASGSESVYTNGVLCAQNLSAFTPGTSTNSLTKFSAVGAGNNTAFFSGEMVHLFFWNQALDATGISNFWNLKGTNWTYLP